jgi:hypothetical protein
MNANDPQCSIYLVRLSQDQKIVLTTMLPKRYSFQRDHQTHNHIIKNNHDKNININHR